MEKNQFEIDIFKSYSPKCWGVLMGDFFEGLGVQKTPWLPGG